MANEDIKVTDRRAAAEEPKEKVAEAPATAPQAPAEPVRGPGWEMREERKQQALPPMDFTTFCLSLASSAMIHLGQAPSPETDKPEKNLPLAKQTIDILVLLEAKTRGNLTPEENRLLTAVLYDLRMRFVQEKGP